MASVLSTAMSRLNAFLDSEMEQILCFDSSLDTETFCKEKCAIFIVLPEEDNTKYFMVSSVTSAHSISATFASAASLSAGSATLGDGGSGTLTSGTTKSGYGVTASLPVTSSYVSDTTVGRYEPREHHDLHSLPKLA